MNTSKHLSQRTIATILTFLVLGFFMALGPAQAALADAPPGIPHQFYGTVKNNGTMVGAGYTVSARVGSTELASTDTDANGKYGWNQIFYVNADSGATIEFYVNGVKATQTATFSAGSVTALDLTVSGATGPSGGSTTTTLGISTTSLSSAAVGSTYSASLQASGGSTPYSWSIASGSLPAGLTLDASSGVISGTPTTAQSSSFTVQVSDSADHSGSQSLSIEVTAATTVPTTQPVTINTSVLGQASSFSISSEGVLSTPTTVSSADGRVQLSLNGNTTITIQGQAITVTAAASPPSPPSNAKLINSYNLEPNNTTFNPALTLTIKYDAASLPSDVTESNLYIAFWTGSVWSELPSSINTQDKTVSAPVSHLTVFAVLGRTGSQPSTPLPIGFNVADLKIIPSSVKASEEVTIIAAVTNSGSSQINRTIFLAINGVNESSQDVTLSPGETRLLTFTTSKDASGSYNVTVEDKNGSFTVGGGWAIPNVIIVVAVGVVIVIVLIVVFSLRAARRKKSFFNV